MEKLCPVLVTGVCGTQLCNEKPTRTCGGTSLCPLSHPHTICSFFLFLESPYAQLSLLPSLLPSKQLTFYWFFIFSYIYYVFTSFISTFFHNWDPAGIISSSSMFSSEQLVEVDWEENACLAQGHPTSFHRRVAVQIWVSNSNHYIILTFMGWLLLNTKPG